MGSRATSAGFELNAADVASLEMFWRSNSDPLIVRFLSSKCLTVVFGAPWALRGTHRATARPQAEPHFQNSGEERSTSLGNGPTCTFPAPKAPDFRCNPRAGFAANF
jgi:hypothetical protein